MASTAMVNSSCNIGAVKFDVKVKPSLRFSHKLPPMRLNGRQMLTIRVSDEGRNNASGPLRKMRLTDEDCEAAVVAGNVSQAPPVPPKPAAQAGTPVVSSLAKKTHLLEQCPDAIGLDGGTDLSKRLVKPRLPYLDIIMLLRDISPLPIAAYQVLGEYSMIKAGGVLKTVDEERVMMESLICLRRAGADIILTYFALQAGRCLCGMR